MNIKTELQILADRAVSAFQLNQDTNNNSICVKMYAHNIFKSLNVVNKIDSSKEAAIRDADFNELNDFYIKKDRTMITIPFSIFQNAVKLAELQGKTMDILYSGKGSILDYADYKKKKEQERKETLKMIKDIENKNLI